jgi:lipoprotein NlpI
MPIVAYYLGAANEETMRKAAASGSDSAQRGQKCEADYYTGSLALVQGRLNDAKPLLQAAVNECLLSFIEAISAKAELRRLSPG